jgi:hypothetical protein
MLHPRAGKHKVFEIFSPPIYFASESENPAKSPKTFPIQGIRVFTATNSSLGIKNLDLAELQVDFEGSLKLIDAAE